MAKRFINSSQSGIFSSAIKVNKGERGFMLSVYNNLTISLLVSAFVAYFSARSGISAMVFRSPLGIIVSLAPIGMVFFMGFRFYKMSVSAVRTFLFAYSAVMGLSLSVVFLIFRMTDVANVFGVTAVTFLGMSIYGYTTKADLTSFGSLLIMCMWGLVVASLVNMFMHSTGFSLAISFISVLLFAGLMAFDTQRIKQVYYQIGDGNDELLQKAGVMGALTLYMDVVGFFMHLMNIVGVAKRDNN